MEDVKTGDAELIFNAGTALSIIRAVDETPFVVVPEDFRVEDLSQYLKFPTRARGTQTLLDADSFILFVQQNKTAVTGLFFQNSPPKFTAVFNVGTPDAPNWGDHRAVYECPLSPQWLAWKAGNGQQMSQEDFALFVERNLPDISQPEAAQMLEIVTSLQAKKKVNFSSGLRLSNGANELSFEEQIEGSAAKGKLQIPEEITLGIPVFHGGTYYAVQAKFRYRIREGKLSMWYELVRPHLILEDAVSELRRQIEAGTGLTAFNGIA